jgi:hypothetical protein
MRILGSARAYARGVPSRPMFARGFARIPTLLVGLVAVVLLAGCGGRLVPDYDRTVIEGLTRINEEAMTLFARTSPGVQARTYLNREPAYDSLAGKLQALRIQLQTRPPERAGFTLFGERKEKEKSTPRQPRTEKFLTDMGDLFERMRARDKKSGLVPEQVGLYRKEYESYMDDALTYEKALPQQGS